jgi:Ca2+-binding RTX toxin-like protein
VKHINAAGDVIPGFLGAYAHQGIKLEAALEGSDRIVGNRGRQGRKLGLNGRQQDDRAEHREEEYRDFLHC